MSDIAWGSVADWVSGIGSIAASITALYLARSADRIQLQGFFGLRTIVGGGFEPHDVVSVRVTNMGRRGTTVTTLAIRTGLRKKRYAIIPVWDRGISHGVPHTLGDGEAGMWCIRLDENDSWLRELCHGADRFIRSTWDLKTFRIEVQTSNGGRLVLRPEPPLVDRIRGTLKHAPTSSDPGQPAAG